MKIRQLASNAVQRLVAVAANVVALDNQAGEWFQVAPYGESIFIDGKGRRLKQVFAKEDADQMVEAFNSWVAKVARLGSGLPIFEGHPDVDPVTYATARRLGKVVELDARPDGLWAKPAWNALGQENVDQGYWVYPSPTWYYLPPAAGANSFHPNELKSVGLTNSPNIRNVQPMAANAEETQDPRLEDASDNQETEMKLTPEQMAMLGLTEDGREYTAEEIGAAIEALAGKVTEAENAKATAETEKATAETDKAAADTAKADAEAAKTKAEEEKTEACNAAANAILDAGVTAGLLTKADADALRADPQVEVAANAIKAKAGAKVLPQGTIEIGARRVAINDAAARQATIAEAVAANEAKGMSYDAAWNAAKNDPALAPLFGAMQAPGKAE